MARSKKQTVDYFPHLAKAGKTLFILESKWSNDGYAFFFKLLETLCETDGHFIDFSDVTTREYFLAKTHLDIQTVTEMLNKLADLNKIDPELWSENVIWYQNLVDNLADVYSNRRCGMPEKPAKKGITTGRNPIEVAFLQEETPPNGQTTGRNRQSKVKESKVEDTNVSTAKNCDPPKNDFFDDIIEAFKSEYLKSRKEAYLITAIGKERGAVSRLLKAYKANTDNTGKDTQTTLTDFKNFFKACMEIQEDWIYNNMTLSIISSKLNEIKSYIRSKNANPKPAYKPNSTFNKRIELTLDDLDKTERESCFIVGAN